MGSTVNKFVLLFVMLVIPLQGVAAAMSAVQCQPQGGERAAIIQAQEGPASVQDERRPVDDVITKTHTGQFCCHQVAGLLPVMLPGVLSDFPAWNPSLVLSRHPFYPEQSTRPPLV